MTPWQSGRVPGTKAFRKPPVRPPVPSEHDEQVVVVKWLEMKRIPFFAVPNGARVRPNVAKKLKAEGMRSGVPDLWLPTHRVVVEMKRRDASPSDTSPEQAAWIDTLIRAGWLARVCKGADAAIEFFLEIGLGVSNKNDRAGIA